MSELSQTYFPDLNAAPVPCPLFSVKISAGYPAPSEEHLEQLLDLNEHLVRHPVDTFFVRVEGESMIHAGIHDGDLLVVDRALKPKDNNVVIAELHGEFTVKRIKWQGNSILLMPENPAYPVLEITESMQFKVWGVVTHVIHDLA